MTAAPKKDAAPTAWENPLIPNKKLKALYVAMVELRLLDAHLAKPRRGSLDTIRGEEGCRVSTTFDLKPTDFTSDATPGVATRFLRGASPADLIHSPASAEEAAGQLPAVARTNDRLYLAMGAVLPLKSGRKSSLLVAYVHGNEASLAEWKPILTFAAKHLLPVIFVVLPPAFGSKAAIKPGQLSLTSSKCGVPGIPVDAADPVALFRVAQESMLRARAGGGPVLMECIPFQLAGSKSGPGDPIATMREFLLHRKIVDETWLRRVESSFADRLKTIGRQG